MPSLSVIISHDSLLRTSHVARRASRRAYVFSAAECIARGFALGYTGCNEGRALKLGRVAISHEADMMLPWRFEEEDGRFFARLTPRYDRDTITRMLFVDNRCHQMFGTFSGSFLAADGARVAFSDVVGFAEHAVNHWSFTVDPAGFDSPRFHKSRSVV